MKYDINDKYFDVIDTSDKFYWYGFLLADGYNNIKEKCITIELQERDKDILEKYSNSLEYKGIIHTYVRKNNKKYCKVSFTNSYMSKILETKYIGKNKTSNTHMIDIPDNFFSHFLRGLTDGDGTVYFNKDREIALWSLVCHENIVPVIVDKIKNILNIHVTVGNHHRTSYIKCLSINGHINVFHFLNWLYRDTRLFLNRKHEKYMEFVEYYSNYQKMRKIGKSSKYRGVYFDKRVQKYIASIKLNNKNKHIGIYDNELDAALAYDKYAVLLRGEKAITNKLFTLT